MTPTRNRDLAVTVVLTAALGYLLVLWLYRWFPPLTIWTGLSSAWVGALVLGWWIGVLAYLLPRRGELRVAAADTAGAAVAAVCALALLAAALWLQHCCKSPPQDPSDSADTAAEQ